MRKKGRLYRIVRVGAECCISRHCKLDVLIKSLVSLNFGTHFPPFNVDFSYLLILYFFGRLYINILKVYQDSSAIIDGF